METITEKLKKAQRLHSSIQEIEAFINVARKAQEVDITNAKENELHGVNRFTNCIIRAYISTGSQSPTCEKVIMDNDVIVGLMTGGLSVVEEILKDKKEELSEIIK